MFIYFTFHRSLDIEIVKMQHVHNTTTTPVSYNTQRNKIKTYAIYKIIKYNSVTQILKLEPQYIKIDMRIVYNNVLYIINHK
jgi:hypothetical protein